MRVMRTMARSCGTHAAPRRMVSTRALVRKDVFDDGRAVGVAAQLTNRRLQCECFEHSFSGGSQRFVERACRINTRGERYASVQLNCIL